MAAKPTYTLTDLETIERALFAAWHGLDAEAAFRTKNVVHAISRSIERRKQILQTEFEETSQE